MRALAVLATLALVGCDEDTPASGSRWSAGPELMVTTDHATGCQYLTRYSGGGITPRRDGMGQHMGCRVELARP